MPVLEAAENRPDIFFPIEHSLHERKGNKIGLILPGQDVRKIGMFDECSKYAAGLEVLARGKKILLERYGFDILDMAKTVEGESLEDTAARAALLRETRYTQPAVYLLSLAIHNVNKHHKRKEGYRTIPGYLTGISQGMGIAAVLAGYMNFETGLIFNAERGRIMQEFSDPTPTSQVTLVGQEEAVTEYISRPENAGLELCIINPGKLRVVGGPNALMQRVKEEAAHVKGISKVIPMDTDRAMHGSYVRPARAEFDKMLDSILFQKPHSIVVSSITGLPIDGENAMKDELKTSFDHTIDNRKPVDYLESQGVHIIYEIGNEKGFLARILGDTVGTLVKDHAGTMVLVGGGAIITTVGAAEVWTHHHPHHPKNSR